MARRYFECILTVAESKRLIARGVVALPVVKEALAEGMVAVGTGSTNGYVVEELLGRPIDKTKYLTGRVQPQGEGRGEKLPFRGLPDLVLQKGEAVEGLTVVESVRQMGPGDVIIKGANALDYQQRVAGILVGDLNSGTVGATLPAAIGRRCHFIIPVGLEKQVAFDLWEASRTIAEVASEEAVTEIPALWPVRGQIVTEIEALRTLAGVNVMQMAAGGIDGAEGSVRLLVWGEEAQVERALECIREVQGEPAFTDAPRPS